MLGERKKVDGRWFVRTASAARRQLAGSVEKVLAAVGTKFLRAADAFNAMRHGGPPRLEQKLSATFFLARTHVQKKSAAGKLLREFCLGSIFDCFNRIDPKRQLEDIG